MTANGNINRWNKKKKSVKEVKINLNSRKSGQLKQESDTIFYTKSIILTSAEFFFLFFFKLKTRNFYDIHSLVCVTIELEVKAKLKKKKRESLPFE